MKHTGPVSLLSSIFLFCSIGLFGQSWTFAKEKDGIRIFTRNEPGTNFKSFRGVMDVRSTMDKVTNLVGNVKNTEWWDENLREIKVLKYEENKYSQYYLIYNVPWPLSDRDLCVEAKMTVNTETGERVIYATPLSDVVPEKPDIVRIKNYWQRWTLQPMGNGIIRLTLEGFVDPAGSVPSWLYNFVITDSPLKVMRGVKSRVE